MALADWQQTGMFNVPSMISTSEITCDLPCPLELWDASNAEEYYEIANTKGFNPARRIVSLKHCMDALMSDTWNGMGSFPFQDINATDLQILIFGTLARPFEWYFAAHNWQVSMAWCSLQT